MIFDHNSLSHSHSHSSSTWGRIISELNQIIFQLQMKSSNHEMHLNDENIKDFESMYWNEESEIVHNPIMGSKNYGDHHMNILDIKNMIKELNFEENSSIGVNNNDE